jgi:hypothetical protein
MSGANHDRNPINLQDPVGKVVGKRRTAGNPLDTATDSKKRARGWRKAFPTPFVPKGVFRFRTYEEADLWMWKAITRPPKN